MNVLPDAICPLCSQVYPREQLHSHIPSEHALVRKRTIEVIQAYHSGWAADKGACEACWKSFRDAGRILSVLKQTKATTLVAWVEGFRTVRFFMKAQDEMRLKSPYSAMSMAKPISFYCDAPHAKSVQLDGDFNGWARLKMQRRVDGWWFFRSLSLMGTTDTDSRLMVNRRWIRVLPVSPAVRLTKDSQSARSVDD